MFRLWGKVFKDNRMLKDTVICDDSDDTRTHKIFHALDALECVAYVFELNVEAANSEYVIAEGADLYPAKNCLLYPGRITLEILPSADV